MSFKIFLCRLNRCSCRFYKNGKILCYNLIIGGEEKLKSLSQYISQTLSDNGIIKKDEIDLCKYGIEYFIISVAEILSVLIISVFIKSFIITAIYFIGFIPLRIYAGGYHADTKLRCYLILLAVCGMFWWCIGHINAMFYPIAEIISMFYTSYMIIKYSPIIHENRNFNDSEISNYRKISIKILFIEIAIIFIGLIISPINKYMFSFSMGQLTVSVSMFAVFVKNKMKGGKTNEKSKWII